MVSLYRMKENNSIAFRKRGRLIKTIHRDVFTLFRYLCFNRGAMDAFFVFFAYKY